MPIIRQLPPQLVNQIAAGEVIERPASVVKELMENSIDAGSHRIEVTITGGGSELIRVSDDGCGMTIEQLPLAIASHATSKLPDEESLFHVSTLGFRGEAMASIASVSHLMIRSRTVDCSSGAEITVRGGQIEPPAPCGSPVGTVIEVRNLFFNTPVRRKFMRSAQTENGHIVEAFTRLALANPQIHMVLRSGERLLHDLPPTERWSDRISAFFGDEIGDALISINSDDGQVKVRGYVCDPSVSRGNNRMQYLFLNGRHIRDRALQHALTEAYRGLLMVGRHPVCFLRLEMPPDMVDVNVHPTKLEVRFTDGGRIYARLLQSLRHRFLSTDMTMRVGPTAPAVNRQATAADMVTPSSPGGPSDTPAATTLGGTGFSGPGFSGPVSDETASEAAHRQSVIQWAKTGTPVAASLSGGIPDFQPFPNERAAMDLLSPSGLTAGRPLADGGSVTSHLGDAPADPAPWDLGDSPAIAAGMPTAHLPQASRFDGAHEPDGVPMDGVPMGSVPMDSVPMGSVPMGGVPMGGVQGNGPPTGETEAAPSHCYLGFQVHNRYLVTQNESGMVVIDQHALHERIMYERIREKVIGQDGQLERQRLLVPEPVSLTPAERAATLASQDLLARVGIEIQEFGGDTILISAYPTLLRKTSPGEVLRQAMESIIGAGKDPDPRALLDHLLSTMACKAAVKAGDRLSSEEITSLLEQRDMYQDTHHCPHGRPTALFFSRDELDRMFGRLGPRSRSLA